MSGDDGTRKVIVARMSHESHAFSRLVTTLADFARAELDFGVRMLQVAEGTRSEVRGFADSARAFGWQLVPTVAAFAPTGGPVSRAAFDALVEPVLDAADAHADADAVVLSLHGAMYVEGLPDPEGELLQRLRRKLGNRVVLAASLDLHANVTDLMVAQADILTSYRTTPHVDQLETGLRLCGLVERTLRGDVRPRMHVARRAMLAGMDLGRTIGDTPMTRLQARARDHESELVGVLDISLVAGYYMGDVREAGPCVLVVADEGASDAAHTAQGVAQELIDDAWRWRAETTVRLVPIADAIARCREPAQRPGPLILADYTDGPGGGGYGDATALLQALLQAGIPGTVVGPMYDPQTVRQAATAGIGAEREFDVGGKTDPAFGGGPVRVRARVMALSDGRYVRTGPFRTGTVAHLGPCALLACGDVRILVASTRMQAEERGQYRTLGVDIEQANVVALKGINHFRADIEPIARDIVFVEAGGIHASDLRTLPFRNVRRPIWPLED